MFLKRKREDYKVMRIFRSDDGPELVRTGAKMLKRPNPVYMVRQDAAFEVATNEGTLTGKPGDYLAHDPISGHVWPVAASYVEQHYVPFES